ncbi:hypothetical protein GCM10009069_05280 [Algimonas arctica]|uniref:Sulfotransferase domain-containing protein n=1 Tax=Algimonas arctica TaxID=1479486 RepID=A0A8J3CQA5_9PROT|nr:hypothetical protein [Algimonas arctica]GHA85110.1 hypothetical protein GCM10009069_05280 [Algimonas arctica]
MIKTSSNPSWLFSYGMPKSGTTTLSSILGLSPDISVHFAKEPNDFIDRLPSELPNFSGYQIKKTTKYLADFSTQYGTELNRNYFLENLEAVGLLCSSRFIFSLREPRALSKSYFGHLTRQSGLDPKKDASIISNRINSAIDYRSSINLLTAIVKPSQIFVVNFNDLMELDSQQRLANQLCVWLGVPPIKVMEVVRRNTAKTARRYSAPIDKLISSMRRINLVRSLPPNVRSSISYLLSHKINEETIRFDVEEWVNIIRLKDSESFFNNLVSGPLDNSPSDVLSDCLPQSDAC